MTHVVLTQPEFTERLVAHQRWLDLDGGEQLALVDADLRRLSLKGARLAMCDLQECDLMGLDLRDADLHRSYLPGCRLDSASFRGANLSKTELIEVTARATQFEAAYLADAQLLRSDLRGATFRRAFLSATSFDGADLRATQFEDADCDQTSFADCVFERSDVARAFRGVTGTLLDDQIVIDGGAGRHEASIRELIDLARVSPADLAVFDGSALPNPAVPWRWGNR